MAMQATPEFRTSSAGDDDEDNAWGTADTLEERGRQHAERQ
jgi:hypothetical protein